MDRCESFGLESFVLAVAAVSESNHLGLLNVFINLYLTEELSVR